MPSFPPTIRQAPGQASSRDPAKYLIARSKFVRPTLRAAPSGPEFEWPMGTEGVRISGTIGTAVHMYLGDNAPVVQVVHRDARQIEMRGQFMGFTGSQNMRDLIEVITAPIPQGYWILRLPAAVFPREQTVVIDTYDFDHPDDDRMQTWGYSISMTRTGVRGLVPDENGISGGSDISTGNTSGNTPTGPPKGQTSRTFTTRSGANTLRLIASAVYGDPNQWRQIYEKNKVFFDSFNQPLMTWQYAVLGPGMQLNV